MLHWFKLKTFIIFFLVFSVWGLFAQSEGCSNLTSRGEFRLSRGNEILVPVSAYTSGRTCNDPLLYLLNVPYYILLGLVSNYLVDMDEKERKKRGLLKGKGASPDASGSANISRLKFLLKLISVVAAAGLFLTFRFNLVGYSYYIIFGSVLFSIVATFIVIIPLRNNSNYGIYYLFHPTKFVKFGIVLGVLFAIILYFVGQCKASYGIPLGASCVSNLFANPSSFF